MTPDKEARLRAWLEDTAEAALNAAQLALDWLDELDAPGEDLEDDEREDMEAA